MTCQGRPTFCYACCHAAHECHPLHRIEFWQGEFFRPAWLRQVGIQVHCGHQGRPCPLLPSYDGHTDGSFPDAEMVGTDVGGGGLSGSERAEDIEGESAFGGDDEAEDAFFTADLDSDFEDEDADLYYDPQRAADVPHAGDLPWIGEAPKQPPPTSRAPMYANDRMIVVVDLEG